MIKSVRLGGYGLALLAVAGLHVAAGASFAAGSPAPGSASAAPIAVLVQLADEPATHVWARALRATVSAASAPSASIEARATALVQAQLDRIEQAQLVLVNDLQAPGIDATVLYRAQRVYNGVAVLVDPAKLDAIRRMPGVVRVDPIVLKTVDNASSVPLIGAPEVWRPSGANVTGTGIKVGVIDTGIDYIHTDFGGSGNYLGVGPTDPTVPWNAKVVGGYDFAGDSYTGSNQPTPDPNPMDCAGHGSHVAGTIAGYGVSADGSTYAGTYGPATDFASLRIGPGVAPGAQLYALKVFGCTGSTALADQAIEWAVDPNKDGNFADHLDVINMSLGSGYGSVYDSTAVASENAALAGVIVVAAAGNDGDSFFITGSPASSTRTISAASSVDAMAITRAFDVTAPASLAGSYPAGTADFGPDLGVIGDRGGSLTYPTANRNACGSFSASDAAALNGKIALLDRGICTFVTKVRAAQLAGAIGALVANNVPNEIIGMADDGTGGSITIPSMFTTLAIGNTLKTALGGGAVTVNLTANLRKLIDPSIVDETSSFSSRGPRRGDLLLKPDIAAPGDTIFSVAAKSGNQGVSFSGTSMATPHMAGVMALLRQLHPTWTVEELKALAMNTATHDLFVNPGQTPPRYGPGRIGAGRVDVANAAASSAIAYGADVPGAVSVSFGAPEVLERLSSSRRVSVANKGTAPRTFALSFDGTANVPGVSFSFPTTLTVAAGAVSTIPITITAEAAAMRHSHDPAVAESAGAAGGLARHWMSEAAGYLVLTPDSGPVLRVPVYAAPRPASAMTTAQSQVNLTTATGSFNLNLTGQAVNTGSGYPADVVSLVSAFELQDVSGKKGYGDLLEAADLRYVGVATDYMAQKAQGKGVADSTLYFGVATWDNWSTPAEITFDVFLDTNRDGTYDYKVSNATSGTDGFVSQVCPQPSGTCTAYEFNGVAANVRDTEPFFTNVMVLKVPASALGLTDASSKFDYYVKASAHDMGGEVDRSAKHTYDVAHPGLWFGGNGYLGTPAAQPLFNDVAHGTIVAGFSRDDFNAGGSAGALLIHHHNQSGSRAQAVSVSTTGTCSVTLTAPGAVASAQVYAAVPFDLGISSPGCSGPTTVEWDFGDGTPHSTQTVTSHVYTAMGTYEWHATGTVVGGGGTTASLNVSGAITIGPRIRRELHRP